jgi:hypothetical protein
MVAATKDRNTEEIAPGRTRAFPMQANLQVFAGTIAAINASGDVGKGITSTTIRVVGVFMDAYNNLGGAAGAVTAEVDVGVFGPFANSAAGDLIAAADVGADCFVVDDQTVAKTNGTNTRVRAGKVWQVTAAGVWIDFRN